MKTFAITSNSELESQCCFLFFPLFCPCRHSSQYSHMYTYFCCSPWKSKKEKLRAFIYQWHYLKYPSPPRLTKIYLDPHIHSYSSRHAPQFLLSLPLGTQGQSCDNKHYNLSHFGLLAPIVFFLITFIEGHGPFGCLLLQSF